ncbi:gliding motility-associated C-terminal domain-containing protein [Flavobacterium sp. N2038]|uniref:Ig-like domain-containing protein n=1 Tax=Flavobacterium sp. N2038 TaxID=2986829 RepID=UPI002224A313|nr:gliding motility-associated C-terminal domain-containing protein [Flavobacterium sp. N2038]
MRNSTFRMFNLFKQITLILFIITSISSFAQVCGTPGVDGPVTVSNSINTYYPIAGNITLNAGAQSILLGSVPATDSYNNNFGAIQISAGDLILIIQMQDATIDYTNTTSYGSGTSKSGLDNLGGTGFTSLGNTGIFEYVIATNNVPLTGGNLTFKGTGSGGGVLNSFYNADATTTRGKRTFQIVRVPQYSNLSLTSNITTPPFNGVAGGVIAFNVSGTFNFGGFSINGTARGFRGGYSPKADSNANTSTIYVGLSTSDKISGKGEGIAGTPKYMWDGFNQVENSVEGLPGGSSGRGAPANAGGGGNDHNTGGGGGGNGGYGGLGGAGWQGNGGDLYPNFTGGGRPGFRSYITSTPFPRLVMGGGGGAGDANNASSGVKGGVGGAIILVNAGTVLGNGYIYANGGKGAPGTYSGSPDGAGGGGAGGTVLLNVANNSTANITVEANGGNGGNTENDDANEHGPGGGGGGGIVSHNLSSTVTITSSVNGGLAGKSNAGKGNNHGAKDGENGYVSKFTTQDIPQNLQINSNCFPVLETNIKALPTAKACNSIGEKVTYEIQIKNTGGGNAAGVVLDYSFPAGIEFDSATAAYNADATGPSGALPNTATANNPTFGGFNIAQNGVVTITLTGKVAASISAGTYSSKAQALYLDPTRTNVNSNRKITAATNAFGSALKKYEGASQGDVPGTNFNGTLSSVTADDITILALPATPTVTTTQSSCEAPTGTITVNNPVSGISYTIKGSNPATASVTNSTGVFSGLVPNDYTIIATNAEGCISLPTSNIRINTVAGAPTTTGVTICQGGTGVLTASSTCSGSIVWYTVASGGSVIYTGTSFNPVGVANSGLSNTSTAITKTYYAACSGDSDCRAAVNFVVNAIPTITGTSSAERCDTGTVTLGATASTGTINWYAASNGGPSLGSGPSFTTPSLSATTIYYVDATSNGCTTASRTAVTATVNTSPTINSTTEDSRCGAGSLTLKATASAGATINWYADPTGGTPLYTGANFTTSSLSVTTTYYVGATSTAGCNTASRIAVAAVINNASTIVFSSGAQNPTVCNGTAIPNAVYTFGGSATNATISNLPAGLTSSVDLNAKTVTISGTPTTGGTYTITTVGHTAPCTEDFKTGTVTITTIPVPTITSTAATCSSDGTSKISNYSSSNTYTFTPATAGIAISSTGLISGMTVGTSYKVKSVNGGCSSVDSGSFSNATMLPTPAIPTITSTAATCSSDGTSKISNYSSSNTYTFTPATAGITISSTGLISGMTVGTSYKVKSVNGGCSSVDSGSFSNATMLPTPTVPTITSTAATCSSDGTSKISNYSSSNTYTFTPATAGITISSTGLISGMTVGTSYKVKSVNGGCSSVDSGSFSNATMLPTPAVPTIASTAPTCSSDGISKISNYISGVTYTFDPIGPSVATSGLISGMIVGTSYTVTAGNATCTSVASASFNNAAKLVTPAVPTIASTDPTCSSDGISKISNYISGVTYTFDPIGPSVATSGLISGMIVGTSYTVTAGNATCTSVASASFSNAAKLITPDAPTIASTDPTCSADGISKISNYISGVIYTFDPIGPSVATSGLISGMIVGTSYTVTAGNATCTSVASASFSNAAKLITPDVPTIGSTAATCSSDGISKISNYISGVTYTFDPIGPSVATSGLISGMIVGTSYTVTAGNATCTSVASASFSNAAKLITPDVPTIASTAPTCSSDGISKISNYVSGVTYTFDPIGPSVATSGLISGMIVGTSYTVTAGNATCTSVASASFSNAAKLATPAIPTIASTASTCSADGISKISNYVSGVTYTFDPIGPSVATSGLISGMIVGTSYTVTAGNATCTSVASASFSNAAKLATPAIPTIASTASTCSADGISKISNYVSGVTYTFDPIGPSVDTSGLISGMIVGTSYTVTAGNATCTSVASASFNNAAKLVTPAVPTIASTDSTCSSDGISKISNYILGVTYTFDPIGPSVATSGLISGMIVGTSYTVTAGNATCTSVASASFSNAAKLVTPAVPTIALTDPTCSADGISKISNYISGVTYTFDPIGPSVDTSGLISGMTVGISYTVTAGNATCTSVASASFSNAAKLVTPAVPTIASTATTCSADGISKISNYVSGVTYTFDPIGPSVATSGLISGMIVGTSYTVTAGNATCTSVASASFSNAAKLIIPDVPTIASINQLTCSVNTGSFTISNYNNLYTYTITPSGATLDVSTGVVTAQVGTYNITATLNNCTSGISTVVIDSKICANADDFGTKISGATSVNLGDVTSNDKLNGLAVTTTNTNVTPKITGPLSVDDDGILTLAANTASGTYSIIYQICEEGSASVNCDSATATVVVKNEIKAVIETTLPINGNIGGTTVALTANDILNGNPVVIGNNPGEVTLNIVGTLPTGLTLNANGTITVSPGTPKGDYNVEYIICETGSNPTNCDSVISVVTVTAGDLVANPDSVTSVVGINIAQTVVNVFTNDTKNGLPLNPADVKLTNSTPDPKGYLILNPDGTVTLAPNAPAGDYELTYTICEVLNLSNCKSNTVTVTVTAPTMRVTATSYCSNNVPYVTYNVEPDNFTPNNLLTIKWIDSANNVVATQTNLPLSGDLLWPGAVVDNNGNGVDWPGWLLQNNQWLEGTDGFENTRTNVTMEFSLNPTVNVIVNYPPATPQCNARPTFTIQANDDTDGPIDLNKGANLTLNIFKNDLLNGTLITAANVVLTTIVPNSNLVLNADGTVDVKSGTPSGAYELTYQICEASNLSNCSQAVVKVTVLNSVDPKLLLIAKDDLDISVDGINGEIEFVNVLDNDLLDGLPIKLTDITITNNSPSPYFEFNPNGTVSVKPNTPGGNYALTYEICQKASAGNCTTATLNVFVEVPAIAIVKTATFNDENKNGIANAGETITYNFVVTNTGNVPLVDVKVTDPLPGVVVSGQPIDLAVHESNSTNFIAYYTIKQSDINTGKVSNQASVSGSSVRGVKVEDISDEAGVDGDQPTVLDLNGCQIKVFNAFSPNGDSKNARFYIQGLECYPDNTVEIYNRWGVLVFDINGYNNEDRVFVGISAGRATVTQADGLPVGTYFYVLKYRDSESNQHEKSGYLYINK